MRFFRNILAVARVEFLRPIRSRSTFLGLATLAVSLFLFHFAFPASSFATGLSGSVGSQGLYVAGVANDTRLAEAVGTSPKFIVIAYGAEVSAAGGIDLNLISRSGDVFSVGPESTKSRMALDDLGPVLRDDNQRRRDSLVAKDAGLRYIMYPLWVDLRNSSDQPAAYMNPNLTARQPTAGTPSDASAAEGDGSSPAAGSIRPGAMEVQIFVTPLVRYFLVFVPILFFSLYFSSAILREKVERKGVYLLSSPMTSSEVVLGKALPFIVSIAATILAVCLLQGIPLLSAALVFIPLGFICLGISLVVASLSNTPHDMNVTLTLIFMVVFAYVFYPAMLSGLTRVSLVSPLGALLSFEDGAISWELFAMLLSPLILSAFVIWGGGISLFQEEVLFSQAPTIRKLYRAFDPFLSERIQPYGLWAGILLGGIILAPLVYLFEVYLLFLLLPLGWRFMYLLVPSAAIVEEAAKVFSIAAFTRAGRIRGGILYGALAGFGFYAAERLLLAGILTGILSSSAGRFIASVSLILTLGVHVVCSSIAAHGIQRSRGYVTRGFLLYFAAAVAIHSAYNLFVMGAI